MRLACEPFTSQQPAHEARNKYSHSGWVRQQQSWDFVLFLSFRARSHDMASQSKVSYTRVSWRFMSLFLINFIVPPSEDPCKERQTPGDITIQHMKIQWVPESMRKLKNCSFRILIPIISYHKHWTTYLHGASKQSLWSLEKRFDNFISTELRSHFYYSPTYAGFFTRRSAMHGKKHCGDSICKFPSVNVA